MTENEPKRDELISVLILSDQDGNHTIKVNFPRKEKAEAAYEGEVVDPSEPATVSDETGFVRKPVSDNQLTNELLSVSDHLTSTAIAFFGVVPDFARKNMEHVNAQLAEKLKDRCKAVAIDSEHHLTESGEKGYEYFLTQKEMAVIGKLFGRSLHDLHAATIMSSAALSALVSEYEASMTNILRSLAHHNPSILISDDESISIGKLSGYQSFQTFMDDLIDEKIASVMQEKSHFELLLWIESKFGVNLTSNDQLMTEFVEICQRRHLIAHSGGIVNSRYLSACKAAGMSDADLPAIGDYVDVSRKYLRRATARMFQVSFFTLHILLQKIVPSTRADSLSATLRASHDFVDSNLTKMCERVCEFALGSNREIANDLKSYFYLNLAQSKLFDSDIEDEHRGKKVEAILRRHDWSLTSPLLDLALACVRRDFESVKELAEKAKSDGLTYHYAMTWSIFREARELPEFCSVFE